MTQKIKRKRIDLCNICGETKALSWDHVPPKGGITLSGVEIKSLFELLAGKEDNKKRISQNGVKYRTICCDCNSRIGSDFDPTLNELNKTLISYLTSGLVLPPYLFMKTKPYKLIKSILSHLVSAKHNIDETVVDKSIREMIFSDEICIPENLHIHYWLFPYDCTVILRDFAILNVEDKSKGASFCHIIKYFPLAFIVSDSENFRNMDSLSKFRNYKIDEEASIKIDLTNIQEFDWPESVNESNVVFMSAESQHGVFARPR